MKYYDFVCRGWCHIRERPARLVSNAFLYTTFIPLEPLTKGTLIPITEIDTPL